MVGGVDEGARPSIRFLYLPSILFIYFSVLFLYLRSVFTCSCILSPTYTDSWSLSVTSEIHLSGKEKNHYSVLLPRDVIYHKDLYADLETVLLAPVSS